MTELSLVQAINAALNRAMSEDARVLVLGEDVGINGGVFRATEGLFQLFGEQRVLDTPLAEASIAGVSIGLAAQGFRPVAEIQFTGFAYICIDQIINHASRLRARTRGRLTCPMVLRSPAGGGIKAVEHHSESPEAMFAHIPGITVDTHLGRVSQRIGLTSNQDPVKIEFDLMPLVPPAHWTKFSHQMIWHGRQICSAKKPKCPVCPILPYCDYGQGATKGGR